jgi:hypothetical protein
MHRDVVGRVALDLVLWLMSGGMVQMAFVLRIAPVNVDYSTGYMAGLASEFQPT